MTSNSKEWIQYATATLMVVSGVTLTFISFFINGDVTEGVLWYTAQSLTFAGAIFGVSIYFRTKLGESEHRLLQFLNEKLSSRPIPSNSPSETSKRDADVTSPQGRGSSDSTSAKLTDYDIPVFP